MHADVVLLPTDLKPQHLRDRACVVFDVLRATTTMAAALHAGVSEIRLFDHLDAARAAAGACDGPRLLCGEAQCLAPPGFARMTGRYLARRESPRGRQAAADVGGW